MEKTLSFKRRLLLLGGSAQQVVAIETAKKLGYYTVLCDYLTDNPGQYVADKFYLTSTTDKDAVLQVAVNEKIDGVLAYASDPAAPTAAYIAEKLGLPGNPYESVEILCNKDKFRKFLTSHKFFAPQARGYYNKEAALRDIQSGLFTLPFMVKPVDSSGSKGITVLHDVVDEKEIAFAVEFAFSFSRCKRIIIEEFVEKSHPYLIGGDIFVAEGEVILWGLMNCHRDNRVNSLVPAGKSFPLVLCKEDEAAVKQTLQRLVDCLGIKDGPMNVELIVDKQHRVFPIDIGPRSGGNMIPDLLGMIFGVDLVEMSVKAAMGDKVILEVPKAQPFYATMNIHSTISGTFQGVSFSENAQKYIVKKCIYKKVGDQVERFDNAAKALGIVFLKFDSMEEMLYMINHSEEWVCLDIRGTDNT